MSFIPFLQSQTTPDVNAAGSLSGMLIPFLLVIVIFYFFMIRPQNKKQKETEKMINALKKGDKVVTIGGIHGVVSAVNEKTIVVKVDDNAKIEFNRSAIATKLKSDAELAKEKEALDAKKAKKAKKTDKSDAEKVSE